MRYAAVESVWSSAVLLTNANIGLAPPRLHKNQKPANCMREGNARGDGRENQENQENQDELSIPMEIRGQIKATKRASPEAQTIASTSGDGGRFRRMIGS